jgi:hypothetical protein
VVNRSQSGPVWTGLETAKDRKRPVYTSPVRLFGHLGISRTGLGLGLSLFRLKTETGPDFQTLSRAAGPGMFFLFFYFILCYYINVYFRSTQHVETAMAAAAVAAGIFIYILNYTNLF